MKQDIMVIRESIGKIVSMLTMQSIKVTQRGSRAFVKYHPKTGAILELNIPYIPDDASDEFIAAIQGFLDHEVGHVLYSDFAALKLANIAGKRVANLANIIEDVYVERRMTEAFRGSGVNLESVRGFYLNKIARPKIEAALSAGNEEEARGYATVAAFRAWGGQVAAQDFIKDPKIAALVKPVADKLGAELMDAIGKCNNSMECLNLAKLVKDKLEAPKPPPPPPPPEGMDKELDAMDKAGDYSDAVDEAGKSGDPEDEGTTSVEADDSGKERDEPLEEVEGDAEGEAAGATDGDAGEEGTSEPEKTDPDADSDMPDTDETDADGDDVEAPAPADSGDTPLDESAAPEGTSADGDGEDGEDEGDGEPGAADTSSTDTSADGSDDMDEAEPEAPGPGEPDPLADMFDTERDFDKDMSDALSEEGKKEIDDAAYAIFSQDWDQIIPAPMAHSVKSVETMESSIKDKIGVMQKQLERAIAAQARKSWNPGQVRGRIAPGSLFKTAVGDERIFRKRFETRARNTAIQILVDCSGSMNGPRIHLAGVTAFALASVLERLKMTYEVIGFTTGASGEMVELMRQDAEAHDTDVYRMGWGRIEPLYMPVFKPFASRLDTSAKSRLAHLTERPSWLNQNVDGECVKIAAQRLKGQRAERHILMVLSDGEPCCLAGKNQYAHLKKTVDQVSKQGVEVIGIGIQTMAVKSFYPKHIVLNDLETLPTEAMAQLTKILLA